mmetsp:Transcript_12702/g.18534  ORF Transcript_12702/g.18534 Transcript_12702/m.18534 type:complete len:210 (+) Transcript_12702:2-631(+)
MSSKKAFSRAGRASLKQFRIFSERDSLMGNKAVPEKKARKTETQEEKLGRQEVKKLVLEELENLEAEETEVPSYQPSAAFKSPARPNFISENDLPPPAYYNIKLDLVCKKSPCYKVSPARNRSPKQPETMLCPFYETATLPTQKLPFSPRKPVFELQLDSFQLFQIQAHGSLSLREVHCERRQVQQSFRVCRRLLAQQGSSSAQTFKCT